MSETQGSSMEQPNQYDTFFRDFETPLMQEIRRQLYGEDNGLHSWGTMEELHDDLHRLNISPSSRIADLGCGPCGALAAILATVGCKGTGIDRSASALVSGQTRAAAMGVDDLMDVQLADLDEPLPFADNRDELERQFDWFEAERHQAYLEAAVRLSREQRMARIMYLAVREQDD